MVISSVFGNKCLFTFFFVLFWYAQAKNEEGITNKIKQKSSQCGIYNIVLIGV